MTGDRRARTAAILCGGIVLLAAVVRAIPVGNDFWLDEIWTWLSVRPLASPLEVFTGIHNSNNNHLNTVFFYLLGDRSDWWLYRVPSLVAGSASVALAAWLAGRRGRLEAVFAALLTGACFSLIHFSSEARGYALAVAFALGAQLALAPALAGRRGAAPLFGALVCLACLAHLVALFWYAGACLGSALHLLRGPGPRSRAVLRLASLHAAPLALLALLWWVDLRHFAVGGGNPTDYALLAARTVGFSLGLPVVRALALPYAAGFLAILALGLALLRREGDDTWIVYGTAIAAAPAVVIGALRPEVVAVRYFLIGIALWLVLASFLLARLFRRGPAGRAAALVLAGLFVAGNAVHTAAFFEYGRGGYLAALLHAAEHTPGPRVEIGSDHDFRTGLVLRFYARYLPDAVQLEYVPRSRWPAGGPAWLIVHRAVRPAAPPARIEVAGSAYELAAEFDHAAISGFWWGLYRLSGDRSPAEGPARRRSAIPNPAPVKGSAPIVSTRS